MKARRGLLLVFSVMSFILSLPAIAQVDPLPIPDHPQLAQFTNTQQTVWLEDFKLTPQAQDALSYIKASAIHGLDPEHYHFSLLKHLAAQKAINQARYFDALLSDALLKLIQDLAIGRLEPTKADPDWHIPRDNVDPAAILHNALLAPYLKNSLNALLPKLPQYHQLTTSLSQYRSYQLRGGWQPVPAMSLLRPGQRHQNVPLLRNRLSIENAALLEPKNSDSQIYDEKLVEAVKVFQQQHGLKIDGIVGSQTLSALNVSVDEMVDKIRINLERFRWLPKDMGERYLLVNLGSQQLTAVENDQIKLQMKVIVGKRKRPTPSFTSEMTHLVINPYWNVPHKLARYDLLPKQQADPDYFFLNGFNIFLRDSNAASLEVDPYRVNWNEVSAKSNEFPFRLQQRPGNSNALGSLKFMFPNRWDIYLHDTPNKSLFEESQRNFSSGCIRVEDPLALGEFSLNQDNAEAWLQAKIDTKKNQGRHLDKPLPVYAVYFTVWPYQGQVIFSSDHYHRDRRMAKYL